MLTIGRLAKEARLTTDSIRFYERQGLLASAARTDSGYRLYENDTVRRLSFIKHAQRCGFSLADIRELLTSDEASPTPDALRVKARAKRAELEATITELRAMCDTLSRLAVSNPSTMHARSVLGAFEASEQEAAQAA